MTYADEVELGMDRMKIREMNWIKHEEFPFNTVSGLTYDSGDYEAATARAMELFGYEALREEQERRRSSNDSVQLGIGISTYTEMCGLAPSRVLGALRYAAGGWETASIRMLPIGKVEVLHGHTSSSHKGMDSYGSRSLAVGGTALVHAADKVLAKARTLAAHMMECDESDVEFASGAFSVRGTWPHRMPQVDSAPSTRREVSRGSRGVQVRVSVLCGRSGADAR